MFSSCKNELEYKWTCGEVLVDERDEQTYKTKLINGDCWMVENLRLGECVENDRLLDDDGLTEHYCATTCIDRSHCISGGLYTWDEVSYFGRDTVQGICPSGWHLPTVEEFEILTGLEKTEFDDTIKSGLNGNELDNFMEEFSCIPYGLRTDAGSVEFTNKIKGEREGRRTAYWSTNKNSLQKIYLLDYYEFDPEYVNSTHEGYGIFSKILRVYATDSYNKDWGLCVRCIKDN